METNNPRPKSNEEIDLTDFFKWIGRGFRSFGDTLIASIALLRNLFIQYRIYFLVIIALGLSLGFLYSKFLKKDYFRSTMVLSCDYLNNQILGSHIEKLNTLVLDSSGVHLADELKIDPATAKLIKGFEYAAFVSDDDVLEVELLREQLNALATEKKDVISKILDKLTIENKDAFQISVLVLDPGIIKTIEKALVSYFNNTEYVKRRMEVHRMNLENRRAKLIAESAKLDSMKRAIYATLQGMSQPGRGSNNVFLNDENINNPIEIFKQDLELNQELLFIDRQLYVHPDFELVAGFTTFNRPENPSLPTILFYALLISIFNGYLFLALWKFDRILATYPTNR